MSSSVFQRFLQVAFFCASLPLIVPVGALASGMEAPDAQYFVAHQVSKVHRTADLLIADADSKVAERVIADLIKHHKQRALIDSYHKHKDMNTALKDSIKDSLLSAEFASWLNEKLANTYVEIYSYETLKEMYQASYKKQQSDFAVYFADYIKHQDDAQALVAMQETLLVKELEQRVSEVLNALPKEK